MIRRFFGRQKSGPRSMAPPGERIYAVGDIHGCAGQFARLLKTIAADSAARGEAVVTLILLGDLIDRGADSRAVIDLAVEASRAFDGFHWLVGNHEEMFLGALIGDQDILRQFVRAGGDATILSYGVSLADYQRLTFEELAMMLPQIVPVAHQEFLTTGEDIVTRGDYIFVHAGIRPGVPLEEQQIRDLRWIRREFTDAPLQDGPVVVHGHTITAEPENMPFRIGVDTGAFRVGGKLTAVGLEGDQRWFLAAD